MCLRELKQTVIMLSRRATHSGARNADGIGSSCHSSGEAFVVPHSLAHSIGAPADLPRDGATSEASRLAIGDQQVLALRPLSAWVGRLVAPAPKTSQRDARLDAALRSTELAAVNLIGVL